MYAARIPNRQSAQATDGDLRVLDAATTWLNSSPLTAAALQGRVVLVSIWTYSCINWRRTAPYLRAWADRYHAQGLEVIGVHTPEFEFEHDIESVRTAANEVGLTFPIVQDNDYAIWRHLANQYWPALYFVDVEGRVRYRSFGEENYGQTEALLQQLLGEAGVVDLDRRPVEVEAEGIERPADWASLRSPETYLGYDRSRHFASTSSTADRDHPHRYDSPSRLRANRWALSGTWTIGNEAASSNEAGARIVHRFRARDLHLVMGAGERGASARFRVLIDGRPPGRDHGLDVDPDGMGTVKEPRLYQLVRQHRPIKRRTFEITFLDPGADAYVFTFG